MAGNDQKRAWERHLGVGTINFRYLGSHRRCSAVLESYFDVGSQDPKVGYGADFFFDFLEKSQKFTKWLETIRKVLGSVIWVLERSISVI